MASSVCYVVLVFVITRLMALDRRRAAVCIAIVRSTSAGPRAH